MAVNGLPAVNVVHPPRLLGVISRALPSANVIKGLGSQLSVAVAVPVLAGVMEPHSAMVSGRQLITGGVVSKTVTVKVQELETPEPLVAVQVTIVVPAEKVEPLGGTLTTDKTMQSSLAVATNVTFVFTHWPASAITTMLLGQMTVGKALPRTETVKLQTLLLPDPSVATQVTVFVPIGKVEPLAGV